MLSSTIGVAIVLQPSEVNLVHHQSEEALPISRRMPPSVVDCSFELPENVLLRVLFLRGPHKGRGFVWIREGMKKGFGDNDSVHPNAHGHAHDN